MVFEEFEKYGGGLVFIVFVIKTIKIFFFLGVDFFIGC